jgi:hypothetical protein
LDLPYRFPDPREEAANRGREFQRLSSTQRWTELAALMALGWKMVALSPNRSSIEKRMEEQEAEAQRIQRELLRRHGR